jgi:hypothetical protein
MVQAMYNDCNKLWTSHCDLEMEEQKKIEIKKNHALLSSVS